MSCAIILSQHSSHVMHSDISAQEKMHRTSEIVSISVQGHHSVPTEPLPTDAVFLVPALPTEDAVLRTCPAYF